MWNLSKKRKAERYKRQQEILLRRNDEQQKQKQFIEAKKRREKKVAEITAKLEKSRQNACAENSTNNSMNNNNLNINSSTPIPSLRITANGVEVIQPSHPISYNNIENTAENAAEYAVVRSPTSKMNLRAGESRIVCYFHLQSVDDPSSVFYHNWPALYLGPSILENGDREKYTIQDESDDDSFSTTMSVHLLRYNAFPPEYPEETEGKVL